jgi:hypothetical protein
MVIVKEMIFLSYSMDPDPSSRQGEVNVFYELIKNINSGRVVGFPN